MATVSYPLPEKDSKSKPLRTNAAQKYDSRTFRWRGSGQILRDKANQEDLLGK
jgi:hypothetical protein